MINTVKQSLKMLSLPFLIPAVFAAAAVFDALSKMSEQGWRYFIPTWESIAVYFQLATMLAFFGLPILYQDSIPYIGENLFGAIWVVLFLLIGVGVPMLIDSLEDRTGRKKIFKFAEVE